MRLTAASKVWRVLPILQRIAQALSVPGAELMNERCVDRSATSQAFGGCSIKPIDDAELVIRSLRNTSSLNRSGCGCGSATRATGAMPSTFVTTPTRACRALTEGASGQTAMLTIDAAASPGPFAPARCETGRTGSRRATLRNVAFVRESDYARPHSGNFAIAKEPSWRST